MSSLSVLPTSTITSSCPSSVKRLSGTVTAVTGDGGMPGYTLSQSSGRCAALPRICAIVPARGDDAGPEPLGQQAGGEPVIAVAVGDEDVGEVPALAGDPVAERARLLDRHPRVGQHRVLAPVDQRAGHRGEQPRLAVGKEPVLRRRVVDEDVVGEGARFGCTHGIIVARSASGCANRECMASRG